MKIVHQSIMTKEYMNIKYKKSNEYQTTSIKQITLPSWMKLDIYIYDTNLKKMMENQIIIL